MIGPAEISAGLTSLRFAYSIAKGLKDIADAAERNGKIMELQGAIMEAQSGAIDAQQLHVADIKRIVDLETEIARLKAWEGEKQRYELKAIGGSAMVYALKPDMASGEPPHWLCPNCYSNSEKGWLQPVGRTETHNNKIWACQRCGGKVLISASRSPQQPGG
jgi:hypothetical protein